MLRQKTFTGKMLDDDQVSYTLFRRSLYPIYLNNLIKISSFLLLKNVLIVEYLFN